MYRKLLARCLSYSAPMIYSVYILFSELDTPQFFRISRQRVRAQIIKVCKPSVTTKRSCHAQRKATRQQAPFLGFYHIVTLSRQLSPVPSRCFFFIFATRYMHTYFLSLLGMSLCPLQQILIYEDFIFKNKSMRII